VNSD